MTAATEAYEVQQHDGLRWDSFAWPKGEGANGRAQAMFHDCVRLWRDRPHRVLRAEGESRVIVIFYDGRGGDDYWSKNATGR